MKGYTNITLYDEDGNIISNHKDDNMITNLVSDYLDVYDTIVSSPLAGLGEKYSSQIKDFKLLNLIGGILLFPTVTTENASITRASNKSVASAGSGYDLSNPLRGTLNTLATGPIEIGGKKAYKWEWDFGTSNGNCTFSSVSLTTKDGGNRNPNFKLYMEATGNDANTPNIGTGFSRDKYAFHIYKNGGSIYTSEDVMYLDVFETSKKMTDTGALIKRERLSPIRYTRLSYNNQLEDNILHFIGYNTENNKYELVKLNVDTKAIISAKVLVGVEASYTTAINGFGYYGNKIIMDFGNNAGKLGYSRYDLDTDTFTRGVKSTTDCIGDGNAIHVIRTVKTDNNGYISMLYYSNGSASSGSGVQVYCVTSDSDIERIHSNGDNSDTDKTYPIIGTYKNNVAVSIRRYYMSDARGVFLHPQADEPLFTINNLQSPVTKTGANTMKVSYTIIFG